MKKVDIEGETIKLDQLLKLVNIVQSGGHAKILIQSGQVKVNGNVEYKRGKKLKDKDVIELNGNKYIVCKSMYNY